MKKIGNIVIEKGLLVVGLSGLLAMPGGSATGAGDPERGAKAFRRCAICHSVEPDRHMTGPSLAGIWNRKAGTVETFARYSEALKGADVIWNEETLDPWLRNPRAFIPGNSMTIRGIASRQERQDITAYLKTVGAGGSSAAPARPGGMMGRPMESLKDPPPSRQVAKLTYCGDTYTLTTGAGKTMTFWEFNLRFKTDSSDDGPPKGTPVVLGSGMRGDRAFVVFAAPEEIGAWIKRTC